MRLIQNPVGHNLYVFSRYPGRRSHQQCVIVAHGGGGRRNQPFQGPTVELVHYTRHGQTSVGTSATQLAQGLLWPVERVFSTASYDYILGKRNNRPDIGEETYETITTLPDIWDEDNFSHQFDVVTLRNRVHRQPYPQLYRALSHINSNIPRMLYNPLTLSEVIKTLWHNHYIYSRIHCLFCRS